MTQEMEEFEKLLKTAPPPINSEARKSAISSGMDAFDQHIAKNRKGNESPSRLMDAIRNFHNALHGGSMKKSQLLGGLATIAIGIALLNSSSLTTLFPQKTNTLGTDGSVVGAQPAKKVKEAPEQDFRRKGDAAAAIAQSSNFAVAPAAPEEVLATLKSEPLADKIGKVAEYESKQNLAKDRVESREMVAEKAIAQPATRAIAPMAAAPMPAPAFAGGMAGNVMSPKTMQTKGFVVPSSPPVADTVISSYQDEGRDKFEHTKINPTKVTKEEPVSTFSIDVDTSSYSFMRASLNNNVLPQKDSVRIEELVNYFPYEYEVPTNKETPFKSNVSVMPAPWNDKHKLIHIGIKGYQLQQIEKPRANLVFLIDTSGSMNSPNRLPLVINSLKLLLDSLKSEDSVAIVTYAGSAGVALEPTQLKDKAKILSALDSFRAGGSTAGAEGIRTAYQLAKANFDKNGVNRVILATDGDFNVGITNPEELKSFVERERSSGIFLSVLGFGMGNYHDEMMQTLAQNGNGNAAYIDNLSEARKTLVEEATSTLFPIAKDVKIQVEFNPAKVSEYHLIGYETRILNREDFNNDKVDAGDIGAGHTVTALYEITPTGSESKLVDDLRYSEKKAETKEEKKEEASNEYAFVKIRYKLPDSDTSKLITTAVDDKVEFKEFSAAPQEARFSTAVAAYAQLLRGDPYTGKFTYDDVITLAQNAKGADNFGYRAEFINLVHLAQHASGLLPTQGGGNDYTPEPQPITPMLKR